MRTNWLQPEKTFPDREDVLLNVCVLVGVESKFSVSLWPSKIIQIFFYFDDKDGRFCENEEIS